MLDTGFHWCEKALRLTSFTSRRRAVQTRRIKCTSTRSTEDISHDVRALGVPIDNDVRARALCVESSNLRDTITRSLSELRAVIAAKRVIELDLNEVARLALGPQLSARSVDEGERAGVLVWRVVAAGHEEDDIGAGGVELLGGCEGREGAEREGVAGEGRHY